MSIALGIDVGGTKIASALVNNNGKIINEIEKFQTPKTKEEIYNLLKEIIQKHKENIEFTAIATAGAVNCENSKVIGSTANLALGYSEIDFQSLSEKHIFIENDANCACWAEYKIGASKGYKNSIMLTLGTGVGGGIIIDGKLLKGKSGSAGEMHFSMSRDKKRHCTCGFYDCFEAYASGNGLQKTASEIFKNDKITTYEIVELAKNNDERAILSLDIWQNDIAVGIVGLANIFDPDCVVLSGSMEKFCDIEKIEKYVNENIVTTPIKVFHATTGNNAGLIGAVLLANELI